MHHAAKHLKSRVPLSISAGFVKTSFAACLAREERAGALIKARFAPDNERIGDITEGPGRAQGGGSSQCSDSVDVGRSRHGADIVNVSNLTHRVDWLRDFGATQYVQRAAIPTYSLTTYSAGCRCRRVARTRILRRLIEREPVEPNDLSQVSR